MPIYEYACKKCGHHLEVMQKMSDKPLTRCPECKGKLEKQFSQTSFQLKGSGWYVTDYSNSAGKKDKKSDTATETKTEKTDTKTEKTDTKTEKKAEAIAT
jgi:putative FmdB family regulatory protein